MSHQYTHLCFQLLLSGGGGGGGEGTFALSTGAFEQGLYA